MCHDDGVVDGVVANVVKRDSIAITAADLDLKGGDRLASRYDSYSLSKLAGKMIEQGHIPPQFHVAVPGQYAARANSV